MTSLSLVKDDDEIYPLYKIEIKHNGVTRLVPVVGQNDYWNDNMQRVFSTITKILKEIEENDE